MIPIAGVLLLIVVVFTVAVVVSNPDVFNLSIFGANIPVTAAGVYFVGAGAMVVLILAALLLRRGLKRELRRRKQVKALRSAAGGATRPTPAQPEVAAGPESTSEEPRSTPSADTGVDRAPTEDAPGAAERRPVGASGTGASAMGTDVVPPELGADPAPATRADPQPRQPAETEVSAAERQALLEEAEELTGDGRDR